MVEHIDELSKLDIGCSSKRLNISSEDEDEPWYESKDDILFRQTGTMIKDRLQELIEEYQEKIEDCSMRVEGMAMATQWVCRLNITLLSNF